MINRTPFIIAELSGNHGGNRDRMMAMILEAAKAGVDAIKFQLYEPEQMPDYEGNERLYEQCHVPSGWLSTMFSVAHELKVPLFASVFAPWAVEELLKYDVPAFKIASPESTRLPHEVYEAIIGKIRRLSKAQLLISSGLNDMAAMLSLYPDVLLYCKAGYPATIDNRDLQIVRFLERAPGFSDHTVGIMAPLAMIGAGAMVIEKHFKITEDAIDAAFSLDPREMKLLCDLAHRGG